MLEYTYNITTDFPNGLSESQLMSEMIDGNLTCVNVVTEDDICTIYFSESTDQNLADAIISRHIPVQQNIYHDFDIISANSYNVNNPLNNIYSAERANLSIIKNIENDVPGIWSSLLGNLPGFNTGTGEMIFPESGVYLMKIQIETASLNTLNNLIHIKLRDQNDDIIMAKSDPLMTGITPVYAYTGYGGFFIAGSSMKITLSVDSANLTVDVKFSITKLLSS